MRKSVTRLAVLRYIIHNNQLVMFVFDPKKSVTGFLGSVYLSTDCGSNLSLWMTKKRNKLYNHMLMNFSVVSCLYSRLL